MATDSSLIWTAASSSFTCAVVRTCRLPPLQQTYNSCTMYVSRGLYAVVLDAPHDMPPAEIAEREAPMSANSSKSREFLNRIEAPCWEILNKFFTVVSNAFLAGLLLGFANNEDFLRQVPVDVLPFPRLAASILTALVALMALLFIVPRFLRGLHTVFGSEKSILAKIALTLLVGACFYVGAFVVFLGMSLANVVGIASGL